MNHHGFRHRRGLRSISGFALAAVAMLAFAGPASAHHHDFGSDDSPAGTISSFDPETGVLTIDLTDGGSISGLVTDETRIETGGSDCRHGDPGDDERRGHRIGARALRHGDHGRGSHHGRHHGNEGSTDDLVAGTVVDDAILFLADGEAVFAKVELADDSGDSTTTAKTSKARR